MYMTWVNDVRRSVERLDDTFTLSEVYAKAFRHKRKYPDNKHVAAKIRQSLQVLRDRGVIRFIERGHYQKISKQ